MKRASKKSAPRKSASKADVARAIGLLRKKASKKTRDGMARYAIPSDQAFGVPVGMIRAIGKSLGKSHELALALWKTGHYEARMLATMVDEPERVTPEQMDRWCRDFDNWAICDTACFVLFDRTPYGSRTSPSRIEDLASRTSDGQGDSARSVTMRNRRSWRSSLQV